MTQPINILNQNKAKKPMATFWASYLQCAIHHKKKPMPGYTLQIDQTPFSLIFPDASALTLPYLSGKKEPRTHHPLLKAMGHIGGKKKNILDTTCGLGQDSFMLAAKGHRVISCEKQRYLIPLLHDAIAACQEISHDISWGLYPGDSLKLMNSYPSQWPKPDIILIDPMYPEQKSAQPKLIMQQLRALCHNEPQNDEAMLLAALKLAIGQVIVKRPKNAPWLAEKQPQATIANPGKHKHCFDIYTIRT